MEELLSRERITLDPTGFQQYIRDKRVLVTGAAGSIGRELLTQMLSFGPIHLIAFDQSEGGIHTLKTEFRDSPNVTLVIANMTDPQQMAMIFRRFTPQVVFHVAAYKHVYLLENQPEIAVKNNIVGTKILADLALAYKVQKFVFVSTDKAVNPIGIMGQSKRLSELYLLSHSQKQSSTQFVITRFGNVLGSSGSVYEIFFNQIKNSKCITVAHPDVTRYLITIPEAVQLVMESAVIGHNGEVLVFDMGEPVMILDLAHRMFARFSSPQLGKNFDVEFTGLKPGEKMHEELLYTYEKFTFYKKGKINIVPPDYTLLPEIYLRIDALNRNLQAAQPEELSSIFKDIFKAGSTLVD